MHVTRVSTLSSGIIEMLCIVKTWQVISVPVGTSNRLSPPANLPAMPTIKLLPCNIMFSECLGLLHPIYHTVAMPLMSIDSASSSHTLATDGHKDVRRSYFLYL
jgi:hypothetical protein